MRTNSIKEFEECMVEEVSARLVSMKESPYEEWIYPTTDLCRYTLYNCDALMYLDNHKIEISLVFCSDPLVELLGHYWPEMNHFHIEESAEREGHSLLPDQIDEIEQQVLSQALPGERLVRFSMEGGLTNLEKAKTSPEFRH